ncbi:MAG: ubiquinol-cytochrome c reductase iron-sulfur subunit [Methyloligellaceae bacterium]
MATETDDSTRRDFLMIAAGSFAAVGAAAGLWPLIDQMNPDASTLSLGSTEVDLSPIEEGQAITVVWRGKPVFIRHRTAQEIETARAVEMDQLPDPLARNANVDTSAPATDVNRTASGQEKWLVLIGICTHLGCIPKGQRIGDSKGEFDGWFCPCHGSHYDTAGRIRKGPAPRNLDVPAFNFVSDDVLRIG